MAKFVIVVFPAAWGTAFRFLGASVVLLPGITPGGSLGSVEATGAPRIAAAILAAHLIARHIFPGRGAGIGPFIP